MKRARKEHVFSIIHDFGENVNLRKRKLEKGLGVFLADFRFRNFPKPIDKARRSCYNRQRSRACSSVGRALRSQRRGRVFESHQVHTRKDSLRAVFFLCRRNSGTPVTARETDSLSPQYHPFREAWQRCVLRYGRGSLRRADIIPVPWLQNG